MRGNVLSSVAMIAATLGLSYCSKEKAGEAIPASDGPGGDNPNVHTNGDATKGKDVFRFETFGNEGFWTDAVKLKAGVVAAKLTPAHC